jgi:hypothetical protein
MYPNNNSRWRLTVYSEVPIHFVDSILCRRVSEYGKFYYLDGGGGGDRKGL